jgi:D-amino-acid dehydrogenase
VTVVDRQGGAAQESSFANGGVIAPTDAVPWAQPGMPGRVMRCLLRAESPLLLRPQMNRAFWRWLRHWLAECKAERFRRNAARMQRLAAYSLAELRTLREEHRIDHEQLQGYLHLCGSAEDVSRQSAIRAVLTEAGIAHRVLSADECRAMEPALSAAIPLAGGLHLPDAETGNCAYFARRLREIAENAGVAFVFSTHVKALSVRGSRVDALVTGEGRLAADAVVVAAGADSAALLEPLGLRLPLYAVKGVSATVQITRHDLAPLMSVMDEPSRVTITRLGNRLRIAGTAELGSPRLTLRHSAARALIRIAGGWFPGAAGYGNAQYWVGAHPMLPDGAPLLGRAGLENLYLNIGHGAAGWAMACGSGRVVADLVAAVPPAIDLDGLTLQRYTRSPSPASRLGHAGAAA